MRDNIAGVRVDGVTFVGANLTGFSCFDHITDRMKRQGRNVWKLKRGVVIPVELGLVKDLTWLRGALHAATATRYAAEKYLGILEEFERDPTKCIRLTPQEIRNG